MKLSSVINGTIRRKCKKGRNNPMNLHLASLAPFTLCVVLISDSGQCNVVAPDASPSVSTTSDNIIVDSDDRLTIRGPGGSKSLQEIEDAWANHEQEFYLRPMSATKDPRVAKFLYRVVVVDPSLYRGRNPSSALESKHALQYLAAMQTPEAAQWLVTILQAPIGVLDQDQQEEIRTTAAHALLQYQGVELDLPYAILDRNAENGRVECPFREPEQQTGGGWIYPRLNQRAEQLLQRWMTSPNLLVRLKAAECSAQVGLQDDRTLQLAEEQVSKPRSTLSKPPRNEKFFASQILFWLSERGNKKAKLLRHALKNQRN